MRAFSPTDLPELLSYTHPTCVSLYISSQSPNEDVRVKSLSLKNAVNEARAQLLEQKRDGSTHKTLEALLQEKDLEANFVVFVSDDRVWSFTMPRPHPEFVMIADHFYLTPLLPPASEQRTYFILELDKQHTRMWQGTEQELIAVDVPGLPESIAEVTGEESNERQLQFHTGTSRTGSGQRGAIFHGSSSWKDDKGRYLMMFLQAVDTAVVGYLQSTGAHLLLSGVEELTVEYRRISRYSDLYSTDLPKMSDSKHHDQQLHNAALKALAVLSNSHEETVIERFVEEPRVEFKMTELSEILIQATQGKVGLLLLAQGQWVWGTFDPLTLSLTVHAQRQSMSVELHNIAARLVLLQGGEVVLLPREQMPVDSPIAALLRF